MNSHPKQFDIISFDADRRTYYPASMLREDWMPDNYVPHTQVEISLGQSRYGGPVIDLPTGISHPENLRFAAQLDMTQFSPFDKSGFLPKTGQLFFFYDLLNNMGKVIYADVRNENLVRMVREHDDNFYTGILIDKIWSDTEEWEERYRDPEDEWDNKHKNKNGKLWDDFAGSEKSKIFGIYTHCQYGETEIEKITFSDTILLLQIGENGFNDEGVFSVVIQKSDLINRNFDNCRFAWGQS